MDTGHNGEHRSFPANKPIPKDRVKGATSGQRKMMKKVHRKRSRAFRVISD